MGLLDIDVADAEKAVLGAVLETRGGCLDQFTLRGDDFDSAAYGDLFDLMAARHGRGEAIDPITVAALDKRFDTTFTFVLLEHGKYHYNVAQHAEIVSRHGLARRLRGAAAGIHQLASATDTPAETLRTRSLQLVDDALGQETTKVQFLADVIPEVLDSIEKADDFVPTPWANLNILIGGLRPGAVYVIGARPGVGKSVIALQLAQALALHGTVSFSSLEMSNDELVKRIISERLDIAMDRVSNNQMTSADWERVSKFRAKLETSIALDTRSSVGPAEIRLHARQVSKVGELSGIVVDYLQLMSSPDDRQRRYEQITTFSRQMKVMAKDLHVPVILLSQLNRESDKTVGAVPKLSDLRDSGAIEQDADVVILLDRDTSDEGTGSINLDVAKNRHGKTGVVELAWQGHFARARDMGIP